MNDDKLNKLSEFGIVMFEFESVEGGDGGIRILPETYTAHVKMPSGETIDVSLFEAQMILKIQGMTKALQSVH